MFPKFNSMIHHYTQAFDFGPEHDPDPTDLIGGYSVGFGFGQTSKANFDLYVSFLRSFKGQFKLNRSVHSKIVRNKSDTFLNGHAICFRTTEAMVAFKLMMHEFIAHEVTSHFEEAIEVGFYINRIQKNLMRSLAEELQKEIDKQILHDMREVDPKILVKILSKR